VIPGPQLLNSEAGQCVAHARPVAHASPAANELAGIIDCRQTRVLRQSIDANPVSNHERVARNVERVRATLERLKGRSDILRSPDFRWEDFEA
jgi:hypothetical protein